MPITPQYDPGQVRNAPIQGGYRSAEASADSFGGVQARQEMQLAQGLGNAGQAITGLGNQMLQDQERLDNSLVRDASSQARAKMNEIMTREVMTKSGKDAIDIEPYAKQRFQEARKEIEAGLKTPKQKALFAQDFDLFQMQNLDSVFKHQEGQRKEYDKTTKLAENKLSVDDAVLNRLNPDRIAQAEADIRLNTHSLYQTEPDAEKKNQIAASVDNLYSSVIEAEAKTSARSGLAYLERFKDKLNPTNYEKLKDQLESKMPVEIADEKARMAFTQGMTDTQALDYANKEIDDPKARGLFLQQVQTQNAIKLKGETEAVKAHVNDAWMKVYENPSAPIPKDVPADIYGDMLSYQEKRIKEADAKASAPTKTDPQIYQRLIDPRTDLAKESLFDYRDKLAPHDLNFLLDIQKKMKEPGKNSEEVKMLRGASKDAFERVKGLPDFDLSPNGDIITNLEKRNEVQTRVGQFNSEFRQRTQGMKPEDLTPNKVEEIVNDMMMPVGKTGENWLGFGGKPIYKFQQSQGGAQAAAPEWTKQENPNNIGFDDKRGEHFIKKPDGSREYRDASGKTTGRAIPKVKPTASIEPADSAPIAFSPAGQPVFEMPTIERGLPEPLKPYSRDFVEAGKTYGVDPALLAAIARHETGNGTSKAFREGGNAMGISDVNGVISYNSKGGVKASIYRIAKSVAQSDLYDKARKEGTISSLASIYAPVGAKNDPRGLNGDWTNGVTKFYNEIRNS